MNPRLPFWTLPLALFLLFLLFLLGNGVFFLLQVPWVLLTGWLSFLWETLPAVQADIPQVLTAWLALALLLGGVQFCGSRILASRGGHPETWKLRWSITITATLLLSFTAGISLVGVVHHLAWMTLGKDPVLENSFDKIWDRTHSRRNLKDIGWALLTKADTNNDQLPPAGDLNSLGQPMHSALTKLLPHLRGELPELAAAIDYAKPWNHPDNRSAFVRRVFEFQFRDLALKRQHHTEDGYAVANYAANQRVFAIGQGVALKSISDGTSNTIFFGEVVERPSAWGDPRNVRDPARGINSGSDGFSSPWKTGVHVLMGDGSTRFLSNDIDPKVLQALSTPAGSEIETVSDL